MINESNLRKVKTDDKYVYVEIDNFQDAPTTDLIRVSTRTLHATSAFGQIESSGWIEKARLEELKGKADKKVIEQIKYLDDRANKVSQAWYTVSKVS